jgi:hypothetical protein
MTSLPDSVPYQVVSRTVAPISPRLLDLEATAAYLAVSPWTVRELEAQGVLPRIRIPLPKDGELRKLLFDRADLDALIEWWKDPKDVGSRYRESRPDAGKSR